MLDKALKLAKELVAIESVSCHSNQPVSQRVADLLTLLGFDVEWLEVVDPKGVTKVSLVAKRGEGTGGVAYLAHTDVVPADDWAVPFCGPFEPTERDGKLYGRGACDMKGSLACALAAASEIELSDQKYPIYFVVTADEEIGMQGARHVDKASKYFEEMVGGETIGIVGEPTNLGIYHAHKGTCGITLLARGVSAHTSTGQGTNANYQLIPALSKVLQVREESETNPRYRNHDFDPPTLSWNMTLSNEPLAVNITTSVAAANIFIRTMPNVDESPLIQRLREIAEEHQLEFLLKDPTPPWHVDKAAPWVQTMCQLANVPESETICFATDGGVLQRLRQLLICGPGSIDQAHRCDEWISIDHLRRGTELYRKAFDHWACH